MSNNLNSTIMTTNNSILVSCVRSNKSDNNVWAVSVQGEEQVKSYCKSPYKAMRYAFLLKKQTPSLLSRRRAKSASMKLSNSSSKSIASIMFSLRLMKRKPKPKRKAKASAKLPRSRRRWPLRSLSHFLLVPGSLS